MDMLLFSCWILIGISWVKIALLENKLKTTNLKIHLLINFLDYIPFDNIPEDKEV